MPAIPAAIQIPDQPRFRPHHLGEAADAFNARLRSGAAESYRPAPLGFPELDACLGGGLRAEDLVLIGGPQNVGKTILALQIARNLAAGGAALPILVCYEHGIETLLQRLICLESLGDPDQPASGRVSRDQLEQAVLACFSECPASAALDLELVWRHLPAAEAAWFRLREYLWRLWLVAGDGLETTDFLLDEYVRMARLEGFRRVVLIVDDAQRVPLQLRLGQGGLTETHRIDRVMRALKGIALRQGVPVVAVAAADAAGLRRGRVHVEDLWGPATVQYEPDVALILNRDDGEWAAGERRVRVAVEKNRHGPSEVEFRHRLYGAQYGLSSHGETVPPGDSFQAERIGRRRLKAAAQAAEEGEGE